MFWTANTMLGRSMLCERCALLALNMAAFGHVRRPYGSVSEGVEDINRRCAEQGIDPLDISGSETGVCGQCGEDQLEPVAS